VIAAGALAGLFAALSMTALMAVARVTLGLPSPAEMIGDVFIPNLDLDTFFQLINRFDGGNGIKRVGIGSVLIGQVVVGTLVGVVYGLLASAGTARRFGASSRGLIFITIAGIVAWLGTIVPLNSVLATNYRGLPAGPATALSIVGLLVIYAVFAGILVLVYRVLTVPPTTQADQAQTAQRDPALGRRTLVVGGATLIMAAVAGGLIRALYGRSTLLYDGTRYRGPDVQAITRNDRFYSVTKNVLDPDVARAAWRLRVDGLVARPRTYTFAELAASGAVTMQEATISCISNDIGDGLASNAIWKGVPLRSLLEEAGIAGTFAKVVIHGADNYVDTIYPDKALDPTTFVAWEMNGEPLPPRHGYPVRLIVPGRFGEKSVKWVTRIEVVDRDVKGFYERQGWGPSFIIQTYSRFDAPLDRQMLSVAAPIRLHGVAFSGDRGISRVEVSTDDGKTWREARFDHQTTKVAWTLWSLDWQPGGAGEYRLAVRAVDGNGAYQTADTRGIAPDGATGYHRITVQVAG
jgi:DMSO/TMAO reductase YedYZ molybdopterin-dependent catalytic subunit